MISEELTPIREQIVAWCRRMFHRPPQISGEEMLRLLRERIAETDGMSIGDAEKALGGKPWK